MIDSKCESWYGAVLSQIVDVIDNPKNYSKGELRTWRNRLLEVVNIIEDDLNDDLIGGEIWLHDKRVTKERILEMMSSGAVKDMEEYRHLVGSMESMDYIEDELKQLLKNHTE